MCKILVFVTMLISFNAYSQNQEVSDTSNIDTCHNDVIITYTHLRTIHTLSQIKDSTGIEYLFFPNGLMREVRYFKNGIIATSIGWHQNGIKSYEYNYLNGKAHGTVIRYYETGVISSIENYKNGFMDGKQIFYDKKGKVSNTVYYKQGNLIKGRYFD